MEVFLRIDNLSVRSYIMAAVSKDCGLSWGHSIPLQNYHFSHSHLPRPQSLAIIFWGDIWVNYSRVSRTLACCFSPSTLARLASGLWRRQHSQNFFQDCFFLNCLRISSETQGKLGELGFLHACSPDPRCDYCLSFDDGLCIDIDQSCHVKVE